MADDNLGGKFISLYQKLKKDDEEVCLPAKWSTNITSTEKNQLIAAATLLGVTFSDDEDSCLEEAKKKVALISTCRSEVNEFIDGIAKGEEKVKCIQPSIYALFDEFDIPCCQNTVSTLLSSCLPVDLPKTTDKPSELLLAQTKFAKLLQLTNLFGFEANVNVGLTNYMTSIEDSFDKEVAALLKSKLSAGISGIETVDCNDKKRTRVKFIEENKPTTRESEPHEDLLKAIALLRIVHSGTIKNLGLKQEIQIIEKVKELTTYCFLTDEEYVRIIGIKAFPSLLQNSPESLSYTLVNLGSFPLDRNEATQDLHDLLFSFILSSSEHAAQEEKLISQIIEMSFLSNSPELSNPQKTIALEFVETDTLVLGAETLTLKQKIQEHPRKIFFTGTMNGKEVYVKIMKDVENGIGIYMCSICCNKNFVRISRNQKPLQRGYCVIEISIPGQVLNIKQLSNLPLSKLDLTIQLLSELYRLSKSKIIHNDIKPSNIVVVKLENGKYQAKLIDFELAKEFKTWGDDCVFTQGGLLLSRSGTDFYNPPEKSGDQIITPKSDIYSLGKVLLEVLVGDLLPFTSILSKLTSPNVKKKYFDPVHANLRNLLVAMLKQTRSERPNIEECFEILEVDPEQYVDDYDYQAYFKIHSDDNNKKRKNEHVEDGNKKQKQ